MISVRVLGLTGGIGSGKSTAARAFLRQGATVVDADALAREAVAPASTGLAAVAARFPGVVGQDGELDRQALGRIVFEDPAARRALESIVHPRVAELAASRFAAAERDGAPLVVYDVPLLYENGIEMPEVCVVWAGLDARRARIAARDPLPPEQIEARIAAQIPLEEKVRRADHVLDNDGDPDELEKQVARLYAQLTAPDGAPAP